MRWLTTLRLRLRSLLWRRHVDTELDDELQFHLDHLITQYKSNGFSPSEARRLACLELGGPALGRDACRDSRGLAGWDALTRDMRFAIRSLRHSRGFTTAALTSLSLGLTLLGTTSTMVHAYLGRTLPAQEADRLFHVWYSGAPGQVEPSRLSALDWSALADVVALADSSIFARYTITESGFTQELIGLQVAHQSLDGLGLQVVAGRMLEAHDFAPGEVPALIGDRWWRERFHADPDVLGRRMQVHTASRGEPVALRVVGVLPPGFRYVREYSRSEIDLVTPYRETGRVYMVRLREGVSPDVAAGRITALIRQTREVVVATDWPGVRLESVHGRYVAPIRPLLTSAWLAAGFVVVIVASNIAILVMLRSLRRRREVAVRVALGAGRAHLFRGVLVEALIVCGAATAISMMLTSWLVSVLGARIETGLGRVAPGGTSNLTMDGTVIGLVGIAGLFVMSAMSIVATLATRRAASAGLLAHTRTGSDGLLVRWARTVLVTMEVAGAITLLVGCGLMVRTARGLVDVDLGITPAGVVRTRVALPARGYSDVEARLDFYDRLTAVVRSAPSTDIAFANWSFFVEPARGQDVEVSGAASESTRAAITAVSDGYTTVLGIPVAAGRGFTPADRVGSEPVALVSESLARRLWPDGTAIGRRVRGSDLSQAGEQTGPWRTVVGIVGNVRQTPLDEDLDDIYVPLLQVPTQFASVMVRSSQPAGAVMDVIRGAVSRIEPRVIVGAQTSLELERDRMLDGRRLLASLLSGFAAFATFLTLVGVYGVTAHATRQRESEVALRVALGATRGHITRLFLIDAMKPLAGGVVLGVCGALVAGAALQSQLFQLSAYDPATVIAALAGILAAALIAAWLPVHRATQLPPARILGSEGP